MTCPASRRRSRVTLHGGVATELAHLPVAKDKGELPPLLATFLQEALAGPTLQGVPEDLQAQVTKGLRQKFTTPPVDAACMALERTLTQEQVPFSPPSCPEAASTGGATDTPPKHSPSLQVRQMLFYPTAEDAAAYAQLIRGAPHGACHAGCEEPNSVRGAKP